MTDTSVAPQAHDYSKTLFLPQTAFPMRAGLPEREPEILARWYEIGLYERLRQAARHDPRFILHDGPPYANGHIHIGHALNKILKDLVTRSQQMLGYDSNYVPGWDCHGLPIEWKIEEEYRAKGLDKDQVPILEFRQECRAFAERWVEIQREEFKRLGVIGDWAHPYLTMSFAAEAQIARELMKFAGSGQLYRGSKPVMWSIVERTALAEAEVEYQEHVSTTIFVKFPLAGGGAVDERLAQASVVIWTTTPWTIPANRAIAYSTEIPYGVYEVTAAPEGNWAKVGERYLLADGLAEGVFRAAKVESFARIADVTPDMLAGLAARHPLAGRGYDFGVPLLPADYVTADTGTGFVHTAPGHGADDYMTFVRNRATFTAAGTPEVPHTVRPDGLYFDHVPLFAGARVFDDQGKEGDANARVIAALAEAGMLVARGRLRHSYPHSWRSKAPLIFRNTPQWFIPMDKDLAAPGDTLRARAMTAIRETRWVPAAAEHRIGGMVENRPDWVISRQRAWGVPITVFVDKETGETLVDERVNGRIADAFEAEGADAWFADPSGERFLAPDFDPARYEKVDDVLDVWFDSGSSHAFTLEQRDDLKVKRRSPGSPIAPLVAGKLHDQVIYLEGTDQHRGFFHSSLLESCGTRGRAPYDVVVTHGFTLDEQGRKMSKSLGNTVAPQDVIRQSGADILRLWSASVDYWDDQRIGPEVLKSVTDQYRKVRNSLRWMLGSLHHFSGHDIVAVERMAELERLMLHRLAELDQVVREAYAGFDYKKVVTTLVPFLTGDLSAFYFDVRKDTLYCDPISSTARRGALTVIDQIFRCVTTWLAPILSFTAEEAWLSRFPAAVSVHLERFPILPATWRDEALAEKWGLVRRARRVVTGALEIERANKSIGSSLEAAPIVHVADPAVQQALAGLDFAEICITSAITVVPGEGPAEAFRLDDVAGVAVVVAKAEGRKCARSWKISPEVGSDPEFPDLTPRDAKAMREWRKAAHA
ncbi:isoleucine--tRNA ligase [Chelatococcus reniformis]|uniref:Isoleucine--tRNA ligase n=1 Tax=Chelatococcus reniformis TaxID=1494448 RepID=A0A916UCL6_9HYPH|nr:isoleucine--tRNA ligase [Chelatococcus reniformis]GGC67333.1 isoleucine--tRNA ligase [Chelatococcus reniformis]